MPIFKPIMLPADRQTLAIQRGGKSGETKAPIVIRNKLLTRPGQDAQEVEFLVKSFRRFGSLLRLVRSIKRHYPAARILVADDSFEQVPDQLPDDAEAVRQTSGVTWFQLPFDTGLGAGRNLLVEKSTAPFLVNCDDDFVFTRETRIENLLAILKADPSVDLVGGLVRGDNGVATNWCGHFRFTGTRPKRQIFVDPLHSPWKQASDVWYRRSDLAFNLFAARRESLLKFPWDPQFKIIGEHLDHFLTIHAGGGHVVYTPSATVGHLHDQPEDYRPFRRRPEFVQMILDKWGLAGMPNHPALPEPNVSKRNVLSMVACEAAQRPNVILFGVGHSGTSIATRMLHALGWQRGDADQEYAESVSVREVNEQALRDEFNAEEARHVLNCLPQPWALKDPRFIHTIDLWLPILADFEPTLIWLVRDAKAVAGSYQRRGERVRFGLTVEQATDLAADTYARWPWEKCQVDYEQVHSAVGLFDISRYSQNRL